MSGFSVSVVALVMAVSSAVTAGRSVRGVVTDESAAVLPGVTIVTTDADGHVLGTTITDSGGRYVVSALPLATVTVTFQLEGVSTATATVAIQPDADSIVNQRLAVAPRSESVTVVGTIPAPPPPPPMPPPPPPRPRPVIVPLPEHDPDSVCGPAKLEGPPVSFGTVRSHRDAANGLYAQGDELVIDGGTAKGLSPGRNFAVRRTFRIAWDPRTEVGDHTAGLVQIDSADEQTAVAVVIYTCDEILPGDRLAV